MDLDSAFKNAAARQGVGPVRAQFHPYNELKHTWIKDGKSLSFRISDYLEDAPDDVIMSLGAYLVHRACGKKCPEAESRPYRDFSTSPSFWSEVKTRYLQRASSLCLDVNGRSRDLGVVFDYVDSFYFGGKAPQPILAWVTESPRRRLGYYFEPLRLLAANRVLDEETVPRYVLEFVIYHELLHHLRAGDGRPDRRVHHTKDFKAQERRFTHYEDAERWLGKIVSRRRR